MAIDQIILYNRSDCAPTCPNRLDNYTIEIINSAGETVWMSGPNPTPAGDVDTFDTDAIGTLTAEAINLENNGTLRVDFGDVDGTAGTDWDLVDASAGAITVNASAGSEFVIELHDDNIENFQATGRQYTLSLIHI